MLKLEAVSPLIQNILYDLFASAFVGMIVGLKR